MICPECDVDDSKVLDSRPFDGGQAQRRRQKCQSCGARWTTLERITRPDVDVRMEMSVLTDFLKLNNRWRSVAREVIRGLLARQALDQIKGKDAA